MAQATIATTVTGLQGHPVATTAPSVVGQLLTWNGSAWAPDNTTYMPVAGGTFTGPVTLAGAATEANQPATLTQVGTAAGVNIGRNYLNNAKFNINQRGSAAYAGLVANVTYTVDRWLQFLGATGDSNTLTIAAASDADRAAIGDQSCVQYSSLAFAGGTSSGNSIQFAQRIEQVRRLSNRTCTLSFWAYSPTSLRLGIAYQQQFGSGGSPSAAVEGNIGAPTLTTGWQRYSFTFTWPSFAGQTVGTAGGDFSQIWFFLSCPAANTSYYATSGNLGAQTGTINLWGMQLEVGTQATPFEQLDPETDLALCQRFFFNAIFVIGSSTSAAGTTTMTDMRFPTTMRVSPTMTLLSLSYAGTATSVVPGSSSANTWTPNVTFNGTGSYIATGTFQASADL